MGFFSSSLTIKYSKSVMKVLLWPEFWKILFTLNNNLFLLILEQVVVNKTKQSLFWLPEPIG
jgi:hypothetical protein